MSCGHPDGDTKLQVEQIRSRKYLKIVSTFIVDPQNHELLFCLLSSLLSWKWLLLLALRLPLGTIGLIIEPVANLILGLMLPQPC